MVQTSDQVLGASHPTFSTRELQTIAVAREVQVSSAFQRRHAPVCMRQLQLPRAQPKPTSLPPPWVVSTTALPSR
jgi:hypothetical protein